MPTLNDILTANGDYTPVSGYPIDDKYEDDSPVINVYDRTIGEIVGDTSTSGENVSQYLTFRIPRHPDHYDLIENETNIRILYRLEDDTGEDVVPVNVVANEDYVIFGWKIPLVATVNPGVVTFIIHAYKSENNIITYHYKTLPKTYMVLETMETDVVVPEIEMYNLAEAYARGTITDVFGHTRPVEDGEPGYHDNSKYYKELAGTSKIDAETAKNAAEVAQKAAETARHAAENARDQAVAIVGGEYVSYGQTQSLNDTQKNKARENIGATGPNGYYPNMTVGLSENFVGTGEPTRRIFNYDTAGGSADISDGNAEIDKIVGGTVAWNQMMSTSTQVLPYGGTYDSQTGTYEVTEISSANRLQIGFIDKFKENHKYLSIAFIKAPYDNECLISWGGALTTINAITPNVWCRCHGIGALPTTAYAQLRIGFDVTTNYAIGDSIEIKDIQLFDLTQMFGTTIADHIYSLEQSQAGAGVAWFKKLFPLDYYPYDEGTLLNVNPAGIKTVGFNAYDKATGKAELIGGNQYQITGTYTSLSYSTGEILTPDSTGCFTPTKTGELTVTGGGEDTCVHLTWSGYRNGDYEDYWTRTRDINIQPYFPDGLKRAGTVYDEISKDKAIMRIGVVDLGSLSWTYYSNCFRSSSLNGCKTYKETDKNAICQEYAHNHTAWGQTTNDKVFCIQGMLVWIRDTAYTDATAFKAAMQGVMLYYELETPIETQIDPPLNLLYQVSDFGTEQFLGAGATEPKTLPIIADIVYGVNYRDTIKNLPKNYAKVRGYYPDLYTGLADNLIDRKGNGTPQEISYRTSCGDDSIADDGNGIIQSIFGKTVVWNQLADVGPNVTIYGLAYSTDNGKISIAGTVQGAPAYGQFTLTKDMKFKRDGRKYLILLSQTLDVGVSGHSHASRNAFFFSYTTGTDWNGYIFLYVEEGETVSVSNLSVNVFDLAQMFGAGNEPSTLDDPRIKWIKDYANEYPEYNSGELISYNGSGIKTVGFNQCNETPTVGWFFNLTTGAITKDKSAVFGAIENKIRCIPSTQYCISIPNLTPTQNRVYLLEYDANGDFIGYQQSDILTNKKALFTTKSNTYTILVAFYTASGGGDIYTASDFEDFCINLSWSGYRNGEYEPYWSRTLNLPISTYFPDGMKSAGSVRDELTKDKAVKRIGVVDLGTIDWVQGGTNNRTSWVPVSWQTNVKPTEENDIKANILCSKYKVDIAGNVESQIHDKTICVNNTAWVYIYDSAYISVTPQEFKSAMSGVMLYYELAEPIETTITPPLDLTYKVADFGTEESIAEGKSTPFIGIIKYSDDFTRGLVNMPKNYDTTASLDALAASLSAMLTSALNGTVTITRGAYDPATKKYEWNCQFTENQVN